jgi:hypothetical protein
MVSKLKAYEALRIPPGATLETIRQAYRREVLCCHPDSRPEDPQAAMARFHEINDAYDRILRDYEPARSPQEFARLNLSWLLSARGEASARKGAPRPPGHDSLKVSRPTLDEPKVFLCFWALAMALGVAAFFVWAWRRGDVPLSSSPGEVAVAVATPLLVYLAVVAAAAVLLVLSREIVWLTLHLFGGRKALPAQGEPLLPKDDPR